jgi:hypothetical protein
MSHSTALYTQGNSPRQALQPTMEGRSMKAMSMNEIQMMQYAKV